MVAIPLDRLLSHRAGVRLKRQRIVKNFEDMKGLYLLNIIVVNAIILKRKWIVMRNEIEPSPSQKGRLHSIDMIGNGSLKPEKAQMSWKQAQTQHISKVAIISFYPVWCSG